MAENRAGPDPKPQPTPEKEKLPGDRVADALENLGDKFAALSKEDKQLARERARTRLDELSEANEKNKSPSS